MYHRVEDVEHDPWSIAVRPDRFGEQIDVLSRARTIVPLEWLVSKVRSGQKPKNVAVVTFDDGYYDVFRNAAPVLERFGAPATMFLVTGALGRREEFWWDALARIIFTATELPATLAPAGGESRSSIHTKLHGTLRLMDAEARAIRIRELESAASGQQPPPAGSRAMDAGEVRDLVASGLVRIGAHSVSHPSLPSIGPDRLREEIVKSKEACQAFAGYQITTFAYPYGDYDANVVSAIREAGFDAACTTDHGYATRWSDPLRLPRIPVANWSGEGFASRVLGHA
jgi:peptidoglycan/xylan/chitin deacetylase (PgdA/CDA1 family)